MTDEVIGQNNVSNTFRYTYETFVSREKAKLYEAFHGMFQNVSINVETQTEFKNRGVEVGLTSFIISISPGDHTELIAKKLKSWHFDKSERLSDDYNIRYVAYVSMRGKSEYSLNIIKSNHSSHTEEKYEKMADDIKKYIISKHNAATQRQIINHFEHIYPEHDIRACMTPLLVAGTLKEKVVYMVND